jgi:hypothetical protein
LVTPETAYRASLVQHRVWLIEREAETEAEIRKRRDEVDRKARERKAKLARERIERLLGQAQALDPANQIRSYVDAALARAAELPVAAEAIGEWAAWAREQADSIDPDYKMEPSRPRSLKLPAQDCRWWKAGTQITE